MSSTLIINSDAVWMPTGWVFYEVLEALADEIDEGDPVLATGLREAAEYLIGDWRELDAKRFNMLLRAAKMTLAKKLELGPVELKPDEYFHLMFCCSQLKAIMCFDPRVQTPSRTLRVLINENERWLAPGWAYDLVLEHLGAWAGTIDRPLAEQIRSQLRNREETLNLSGYDTSQFTVLLAVAEWLHGYYGDAKGRISHAPALFEQLAPYINEFYSRLKSDPRAESKEDDPLLSASPGD